MPRGDISDHFWNKERVETRSSVALEIVHALFLKGAQTTNARSPNNANAVFADVVRNLSVIYRFVCHHHGKLCKEVHLSGFFAVQDVARIEVFYLASKLGLEL